MRLKFILLFLFLLLLPSLTFIYPQEKKIVIFAEVDSLPANSKVYITGGNDELGNWNQMQKMKKRSYNSWSFKTYANTGDTLFFKFTRGDWSTEAVDSNGIEFPNFIHVVKGDTTLKFKITKWRDQVQQKIILTEERIKNKGGFVELFEGWKYKIGDDSSWADHGL